MAFSVNGGHYDSTQLLRHADFAADRLFIDGAMAAQDLWATRERMARYRLVINTIADPGSETPALRAAQLLCGGLPVLNEPARVLATTREQVAAQLQGAPGLRVPRVERLAGGSRQALLERLRQHPAGLIVRPENSQTGVGVQCVRDEASLEVPAGPCYATDFHDFRSADGLYRKFRVFAIGGRLWPEHLITATQWNIHSADRREAMLANPLLRQAEQDFLADPAGYLGAPAWQTLQAIPQRLGLDYLGIDFGLLDGEVLLFEANPAMRLNFDHCERFPYLLPHLEAVSRAFSEMVGLKAGLHSRA